MLREVETPRRMNLTRKFHVIHNQSSVRTFLSSVLRILQDYMPYIPGISVRMLRTYVLCMVLMCLCFLRAVDPFVRNHQVHWKTLASQLSFSPDSPLQYVRTL